MKLKLINGYPEYFIQCPNRPWENLAQQTIEDWESQSMNVTAGVFPGGAEVELLEQQEHQFEPKGTMEGQLLVMYKVRGQSIKGTIIEGWVTAHVVEKFL